MIWSQVEVESSEYLGVSGQSMSYVAKGDRKYSSIYSEDFGKAKGECRFQSDYVDFFA